MTYTIWARLRKHFIIENSLTLFMCEINRYITYNIPYKTQVVQFLKTKYKHPKICDVENEKNSNTGFFLFRWNNVCQQCLDHSVLSTAINANIKNCRYSIFIMGQDWFQRKLQKLWQNKWTTMSKMQSPCLKMAFLEVSSSVVACTKSKSFKQLKVETKTVKVQPFIRWK